MGPVPVGRLQGAPATGHLLVSNRAHRPLLSQPISKVNLLGIALAFAGVCEAYSVLRPRRWLQRAIVPVLEKAQAATHGGPLVGMHLRSGFADEAQLGWPLRPVNGMFISSTIVTI